MADDSDDRDEDDKKSRDYLDRDDAIAPRPLAPATLTIPIAPPKPDKKLGKDKDAVRFVGKLGKKQQKLRKDAHPPPRLLGALPRADRRPRRGDGPRGPRRPQGALRARDHGRAERRAVLRRRRAPDLPSRAAARCSRSSAVYLLVYVLVALYFFLQAIESLRPRKSQPQVRSVDQAGLEEFPLGIRFYEDILRRDVDAYRRPGARCASAS